MENIHLSGRRVSEKRSFMPIAPDVLIVEEMNDGGVGSLRFVASGKPGRPRRMLERIAERGWCFQRDAHKSRSEETVSALTLPEFGSWTRIGKGSRAIYNNIAGQTVTPTLVKQYRLRIRRRTSRAIEMKELCGTTVSQGAPVSWLPGKLGSGKFQDHRLRSNASILRSSSSIPRAHLCIGRHHRKARTATITTRTGSIRAGGR